MKTVVHLPAKAEWNHAIAYHESKVSGRGLDFHDKVEQAIHKIQQSPKTWPRHHDKRFRKCVMEHFPFVIFYR